MGSTFGGLNILSRSLYAQQASLNTVGHNIANADTNGYSRQRVNMVTMAPTGEVYGSRGVNQAGTGVSVGSIMRARDTFTDRQLWKESSTLGYSQVSKDALGRIEGVFSEPSETGIQTVLNQFWTSWQTLSTNASDTGARTAVAQRGIAVVNAIKHAATQLTDTVENINSSIEQDVLTINQITSSIDKLNQQIAYTEVGGKDHANDLRDSRDLLVDQLSKLVDISVKEESSGKYTITTSGLPPDKALVDGINNDYTKLGTVPKQGEALIPDDKFGYPVTNVVIDGTTTPLLNFTNGEVKALIDSRDSDKTGILAYMTNLDKISQFLLEDFNEVHQSGFGTDNASGRNFFEFDSTADLTASSWINGLMINPDITASTAGLAIIAAKTAVNAIAVTASATNSGTEVPTVSTTGTYTGGTTATAVTVKVDSSGVISCSTDGGTRWDEVGKLESPPSPDPDPITITIMGLSIDLDTSALTPPPLTPPPGVDNPNIYNFTLSAGNNASGDNAIKLGIRLKTDVSTNLGDISLDAFYSSMIGTLGIQSQDAKRLDTNQQTVVNHLTNLRASVSGVNMDEEMTDMIRFQKGYNAAARVLTAMDEMLDKLINGTGVVGR